MKTEKISLSIFKSKCLQFIDIVEKKRIALVITKHGKPIAKLVPIDNKKFSLFGCMQDSVIIKKDIIHSPDEKWDVVEKLELIDLKELMTP